MHTTKLLDLNGKDDSVWAVMRDGTAVWLSRECFKNLHKHDPLVSDKHRESACIDKRARLIRTELRDARHFPKLRQEITGIKDNLRCLAHSRGYTQGSSAITMGWMLFSMCCKRRRRRARRKKEKASEGYIWTTAGIIMRNDPVPTCWGGQDELELEAWGALLLLLILLFFISPPFSQLISIAILRCRGPSAAIHTCCDLYSK